MNSTHASRPILKSDHDTRDLYIAARLRAWAQGDLPREAAVELVATACDGRLLTGPWARLDKHGRNWFDPDRAASEKGFLSGGERRVLEVATSLVSSDHPVDLSDAICGLDPNDLGPILAAISHAGGGHRL